MLIGLQAGYDTNPCMPAVARVQHKLTKPALRLSQEDCAPAPHTDANLWDSQRLQTAHAAEEALSCYPAATVENCGRCTQVASGGPLACSPDGAGLSNEGGSVWNRGCGRKGKPEKGKALLASRRVSKTGTPRTGCCAKPPVTLPPPSTAAAPGTAAALH